MRHDWTLSSVLYHKNVFFSPGHNFYFWAMCHKNHSSCLTKCFWSVDFVLAFMYKRHVYVQNFVLNIGVHSELEIKWYYCLYLLSSVCVGISCRPTYFQWQPSALGLLAHLGILLIKTSSSQQRCVIMKSKKFHCGNIWIFWPSGISC